MPSGNANLVLLTIDDEESVRTSVAAYFEDCGFKVLQASDGGEGLEMISRWHPDIVITDLRMPHIDGLEVVETIARRDDNLPIIVLSGTGILSDAIEAIRAGAWDYLGKPVVDLIELELMVARCIERARLVRENRTYNENLEQLVKERTVELRKLNTAVEQSANSIVITDATGIIEYVNPKFLEVTGYGWDDVIGQNPRILKSGRQPDSYYANLWNTITSGKPWEGEFCNKTKEGRFYWELTSIAPVKDENGTITSFVSIKEDITGRKLNEEKLFHQANFDPLTGLPNRYYFQKYLELQIASVDSEQSFLMLLVLDIDNLKHVNDTFGHDFGDLLIKKIGGRLQTVCGDECVVSRFVGDEFTVVMPPSADAGLAERHAEKIRAAMNDVFSIGGTEIIATASIGVAVFPDDGNCLENLLKNGEAAMYQAKKEGKNTICFYTSELNSKLQHRFALEAKLYKAFERNEFSLQYQPQVHQGRGEVVGVEALLRWTPTDEKPVPPGLFIPILEESGMIVQVGEWVLSQACSQAAEWHRQGVKLRMSINISALQFMRSDLDVTVRRVIDNSGFDPRCLCLELTESMIMVDTSRTMDKMRTLSNLGVSLSLDDFGTGYSSLEYLGRMPINELKIDMSFVRRMLTTRNDAAVVATIIAMARGLDMELVAEGVETEEQLRYLVDRHCTVFQGYYYSPPLVAADVVPFCRTLAQK